MRDYFLSEKKRAEGDFPTMLLLTQGPRGGRAAVSVTFLERQRWTELPSQYLLIFWSSLSNTETALAESETNPNNNLMMRQAGLSRRRRCWLC